jgi:hypothetical protein
LVGKAQFLEYRRRRQDRWERKKDDIISMYPETKLDTSSNPHFTSRNTWRFEVDTL